MYVQNHTREDYGRKGTDIVLIFQIEESMKNSLEKVEFNEKPERIEEVSSWNLKDGGTQAE